MQVIVVTKLLVTKLGHQNIDGVDVLDIIEAADGFAQVAPKHKYYIVDCLQKRGHITGF
jgi:magnesium-transporting ATPase (P-type)